MTRKLSGVFVRFRANFTVFSNGSMPKIISGDDFKDGNWLVLERK
jgi:hypothetical protein